MKPRINMDSYALITGAGSGIGRCYAKRLAADGYKLILAGNVEGDLLETKVLIQAEYPAAVVEYIVIDLAIAGASQELFNQSKAFGNVDILVNNAGIFCFRDVVECTVKRVADIVMLHDMNVALNCKLFSEDMIERGVKAGYILNMSSYSVWMPFPGLSLYSASKAFIRSFSIAFAKEVRERNIYVTTVCPAGVATNLYGLPSNLQRLGCRLGVLITPDNCAKRALRALWHKRRSVVPDWWNKIFIPFAKVMPAFVLNFIRRKTMQFQS